MEDAKEIHTCLKKAAGIFKEFKVNIIKCKVAQKVEIKNCLTLV